MLTASSPVQVVVAVGEDAILGHPETQQGTEEEQRGQQQVEMSPDQDASEHLGQQVGCQHQGGIEDPEDERPCCSQRRRPPGTLVQAGVHLGRVGSGLQIHDQEFQWTASSCWLCCPSSGRGPQPALAHVDRNSPPLTSPPLLGNIVGAAREPAAWV